MPGEIAALKGQIEVLRTLADAANAEVIRARGETETALRRLQAAEVAVRGLEGREAAYGASGRL
jgi:hypothetical protein